MIQEGSGVGIARLRRIDIWSFATSIRKRTVLLVLTLLSLPAYSAEREQGGPYPPYPDVWQRQVVTKFEEILSFSAWNTANGDVLISYISSDSGENATYSSVLFFSGQQFKDAMEPGERLPSLRNITQSHRIRVGPDRALISISRDDCARGIGAGMVVQDSGGRALSRKSVVLILERMKRYSSATCEEQELPSFESVVAVLNPYGFVELADGTILVGDMESPTVLRMQVNPEGISIPPGTGVRAFVVDTQELERDLRTFIAGKERLDWKEYLDDLGNRLLDTGGRLQ
jgi:hypothetical protein